jgi:catechol-2,3-dioxygenase
VFVGDANRCGSNQTSTLRSACWHVPPVLYLWQGAMEEKLIQHISAVTFAVHDMARSIEFYRKLGFELLYGGDDAVFSSLKAGEAFVNLSADPEIRAQ